MLWLANTGDLNFIKEKKTEIAIPVQTTPKIVADIKLVKVIENIKDWKFKSLISKKTINRGTVITAAKAIEQKANSNDDWLFNFLTQFAEKAYIIAERIIRLEKKKLFDIFKSSKGFIKIIIPINPVINPQTVR